MPLFDYFRAPDADVVRQVMDAGGGCTPVGNVFDGIDAKGVDPTVVLGMMIAAIQQVPWNPDLMFCRGRKRTDKTAVPVRCIYGRRRVGYVV